MTKALNKFIYSFLIVAVLFVSASPNRVYAYTSPSINYGTNYSSEPALASWQSHFYDAMEEFSAFLNLYDTKVTTSIQKIVRESFASINEFSEWHERKFANLYFDTLDMASGTKQAVVYHASIGAENTEKYSKQYSQEFVGEVGGNISTLGSLIDNSYNQTVVGLANFSKSLQFATTGQALTALGLENHKAFNNIVPTVIVPNISLDDVDIALQTYVVNDLISSQERVMISAESIFSGVQGLVTSVDNTVAYSAETLLNKTLSLAETFGKKADHASVAMLESSVLENFSTNGKYLRDNLSSQVVDSDLRPETKIASMGPDQFSGRVLGETTDLPWWEKVLCWLFVCSELEPVPTIVYEEVESYGGSTTTSTTTTTTVNAEDSVIENAVTRVLNRFIALGLFNFLEGDNGEQGPQGATGATGERGAAGSSSISSGGGFDSSELLIGDGTIDASAILQANSTSRGFLAPRMTTAERDAISSPATGLLIYNTTTSAFNTYDGATWGAIGGGGGSVDLTTGVTGVLPVSNGGTGAATFTTNGVLFGNGTSALQATVAPTSGQLLVGNVSGVPVFVSVTGDIVIDNTGATTIQANSVTLGTDTAGNYVASVAGDSQISVSGSGSESAAVTLSVIADSIGDTQLAFNTGQHLTTTSSPTFADLTVSGDDLFMGTNTSGFILVADGTNFNPVAMSGDITIDSTGATSIGSDKVTEADLKAVDSSVDEECLTYESTTGDFEWQTCGGSSTLSALTAASGTNSIDNTSYAQTWSWSTLAGASALTLSSTSTAASSNAQTILNIALSGANSSLAQTTYGAQISNTHTNATSGTNVALYLNASGATTANYGLIVNAGNVGIGTTTPDSVLSITGSGTTGLFGSTGAGITLTKSGSSTSRIVNTGGMLDFVSDTSSGLGLRVINANVFSGSGDVFFQAYTGSGGYAVFEGYRNDGTSAGTILSSETAAKPIIFAPGRSEVARIISGNFGIGGDTSPNSLFSVGSTSQFQVNSSGAIAAATGVTSSGTITFSGLSTAGIVQNSAAGVLSTSIGSNGECLTTSGGVIDWGSCGGVASSVFSGLSAAAATNSIDNTSYAQTWSWSTLAGASALTLSSTSTAAASNAQTILNISTSGANASLAQTTYGAQISNTHTNVTSGTNVALYLNASGATTANYGLIVNAGNVGLGITNPSAKLSLGTDITTAKLLMFDSGNTKYGMGMANYTLRIFSASDGNISFGKLSTADGTTYTDIMTVLNTGNVSITGDLTVTGDDLFMTTNTSGHMLIADGTNYNPVAMSGDITITSGGVTSIGADKVTEADLKVVDSAVDEECFTYESTTGDFEWQTCSQWTTNGTSIYYSTGNVGLGIASPGAKLSLGTDITTSKLLMYDSGNTKYGMGLAAATLRIFSASDGNISFGKLSTADGTTYTDIMTILNGGNVGIGDTSPDATLNVLSTTEQLRLDYSDSFYTSFTTSSAGDLTIAPNGGDLAVTGALASSGVLQGGSATATTYSRLGTGTAGNLDAANDLLVSDELEVDGVAYFDGTVSLNTVATSGRGLYATSSTLTSGWLVDLQVSGTAAATNQTALNILTAGANATSGQTTYGAQISNTHTNVTSGTNVALYLNASGATTANYGLIVNSGYVGIGTTAPGAKLSLGTDITTSKLLMFDSGNTKYGFGLAAATLRLFSANNGNISFGTVSTTDGSTYADLMTILNTGKVGIGITNPSYPLHVVLGAAGVVARFTDSDGSCDIDPTSTALICTSDERLKKDVTTIESALEKVLNFRGVNFRWESQTDDALRIGFLAQEIERIVPELVKTDPKTGLKSVNYVGFAPILVNAIKEQQDEINLLTASVGLLQGNIEGNIPSSTIINNHLYLSGDSVGQAQILSGDREVRVDFEKPYEYQPIVTISPRGEAALDNSFRYAVIKEDELGFTIKISSSQNEDVEFSWHAFASEGAKLTVSDGSTHDIVLVVAGQQQSESDSLSQDPDPVIDEGSVSGAVSEESPAEEVPITEPEQIQEEPQVQDSVESEPEVSLTE